MTKTEGVKEDMYEQFFNGPGCIAVRNVFTPEIMERYNLWCEDYFSKPQQQKNTTHPKQTDKLVINDVFEEMSANDPELLLLLSNNPTVNRVLDTLLGFSTFGALTAHWIKPGISVASLPTTWEQAHMCTYRHELAAPMQHLHSNARMCVIVIVLGS
jgi:hypothetical protein